MKINIAGIAVLITSVLLMLSQSAIGREPPVAKLVQITGAIEYSRNGATWRPVKRTKYLFAGYQIKTGADGGGKFINQQTGMSQTIGANSAITVNDGEISLISGKLSKPTQESASIFEGLSNKFAKAQRYTTVRRSVTKEGSDDQVCDNKVKTVRKVTLSEAYPSLVWRNACPEYSYKLIVDGEVHEVSASSNAEMIRFDISDVKPGKHSYKVEVLDQDGTVYSPKKESSFTWLDNKAAAKIAKTIKSHGDDIFMTTDLLESEGILVGALDVYRNYFDENGDDNDMRPLLIKSYNDLKLSNLKKNEARLYQASLAED